MFIAFEGPDGSGKTTIMRMFAEQLKSEGLKVLYTREPGGCQISEEIRKIIMTPGVCGLTEVYLFAAAREQHIHDTILPALSEGYIVLSDRYFASTIAFQLFGRGISPDRIPTPTLLPDWCYFMDIPLEVSLARLTQRKEANEEINRLDEETLAFKQRVNTGYQWLLSNEVVGKMVRIDATRTQQEILSDLLKDFRTRARAIDSV